jgi:tetratricopeptide (TPR) repeat protein
MDNQPIIEKISENYWETFYPDKIDTFFENFWDAVELMDTDSKQAERIFKNIITNCGNGHLDAILHLGFLYLETGKIIEGNALVIKAYKIAKEAFPDSFNPNIDQLRWIRIANRPILRAIHSYGLELIKEGKFEKAIEEFEFIININPNDNQGVRYLIINCLFALDRPADIFKLDKQYPDDYSVEFLYGKFLAYYLLNEKEKAKEQFEIAKRAYPFVAEELIKTKHIFPADEFDTQYGMDGYGYPIGSKQEAFDYWDTTKMFWKKAKGIIGFIKTIL